MTVMDMAAGSGNLKRGAHRGHVRALRRQARGRPIRTDPELSTRSATAPSPEALASFGVQVVEVTAAELAPACTSNGHTNKEPAGG